MVFIKSAALTPADRTAMLDQMTLPLAISKLPKVFDFFGMRVKTAGGQLVQPGLPEIGACGVYQCDLGPPFFFQALAQLGNQCQTTCVAADDDDDDALHKTPPSLPALVIPWNKLRRGGNCMSYA